MLNSTLRDANRCKERVLINIESWRFVLLNRLASEIKELNVVEKFCAQEIPESRWLDYKQDFQPSDKANYQVAKIISAMANAHGGWILYGVKEKKDSQNRGIPDGFAGVLKSTALGERVKQICLDRIYPPIVPDIGTVELSADREIVLIHVLESDSTPHQMTDSKVYVRTNDISHIADDGKEASVQDIELLLNRRSKAVDLRTKLFTRAEQRSTYERFEPQVVFYCAPTYPDEPVCSYLKLIETAKNLENFECFKGLGVRLHSAHESVVQHFRRHGRYDERPQESFFEATFYGSLYFCSTHFATPSLELGGGYGISGIGCATLLFSLIQASDWLLQELDYRGVVDISFGLRTNGATSTIMPPESGGEFFTFDIQPIPDHEFTVRRRVLTNQFYSLDSIDNMYREFLWSAGMGQESWDWNRPTEIIQKVAAALESPHRLRAEAL